MGADARRRGPDRARASRASSAGSGDFGANVAAFETLAFGDLSLLVKFGVQFGLWGGAVQQLGTRGTTSAICAATARWRCPAALR